MRIKATILLFILLFTVICPVLSSCTPNYSGTETAMQFLSDINDKNFKSAYKLVSADCTKEEFIEIYEDFYNTLSITGITYTATSSHESKAYSEYNYTLTYHSDLYGDISDDYQIITKLNSKKRHYIPWTPALVIPEMNYGDTVSKSRICAKRGDIVSNDGAVLAKNEPVTAISIITETSYKYSEKQIMDNVKLLSDKLGLKYDDVKSKLYYHIYMYTQNHVDSDKKPVYDESALKKSAKALSKLINIKSKEINNILDNCKDEKVLIASILPDEITPEIKQKISKIDGVYISTSNYNNVALVAEFNPGKLSEETKNALSNVAGIIINESSYSSARYYPYGSALTHVLGYLRNVSDKKELAKLNEGRTEADGLYTESSNIGVSGIEKAYETQLRGKDGYRICLRSSTGEIKRNFFEQPAENGQIVKLSVNMELQQTAEALLSQSLYGNDMGGSVIVMNPKTGEVQAMASYPTYDLNSFSLGMTKEEYTELSKLNAPFINRALYGYAPGSVFKPITAAAALSNNVLGYNYVFKDTIVNDHWKPVIDGVSLDIKRTHVVRRNEPLNMRNALVHSDNIYFANATLKLGEERLEEYWNNLGLNEAIPFELPVRKSQFKSTDPETDSKRTLQTIAETGFGQGTMLVTPIQLASVYCAFSNGGYIPVPFIVSGSYLEDGNNISTVAETTPAKWKENAVSSSICKRMTEMLKDVVSPKFNGTGSGLHVTSCVVAGKTGTAEVIKNSKDNSWFIGYRTNVDEKDERLVLVVLEVPVGDQYTKIKLQIAKKLLELNS